MTSCTYTFALLVGTPRNIYMHLKWRGYNELSRDDVGEVCKEDISMGSLVDPSGTEKYDHFSIPFMED